MIERIFWILITMAYSLGIGYLIYNLTGFLFNPLKKWYYLSYKGYTELEPCIWTKDIEAIEYDIYELSHGNYDKSKYQVVTIYLGNYCKSKHYFVSLKKKSWGKEKNGFKRL